MNESEREIIALSRRYADLDPVDHSRVSNALWDASIGKLNKDPANYGRYYNRLIIHMIDSVSRGYTSPVEAYDALAAEYFPEYLTARRSAYEHTI